MTSLMLPSFSAKSDPLFTLSTLETGDPFASHRLSSTPPDPTLSLGAKEKNLLPLLTQARIIQQIAGSEPSAKPYEGPDSRGRCSVCQNKSFSSLRSAKEHVRKTHKWRHECTICQKTFSLHNRSKRFLAVVRHVITTHRTHAKVQGVLQRPHSGRILRTRNPFVKAGILYETPILSDAAEVISLPNGWFACPHCPKICAQQKIKVLYHILSQHQGVLMVCDICQKRVGFRYGDKHIKTEHPTHTRVLKALGTFTESREEKVPTQTDSSSTPPQVTEEGPPPMDEDVPALLFQTKILQRVSSSFADTMEVCTLCTESLPPGAGAIHVWENHWQEEAVRNALLFSCGRKWTARPSKEHHYFTAGLLKLTIPLSTEVRMVQKKHGEFSCSGCGKHYSKRNEARRHIVETHQKVRANCTLCTKTFVRRSAIAHVDRKHRTHPEVATYLLRKQRTHSEG